MEGRKDLDSQASEKGLAQNEEWTACREMSGLKEVHQRSLGTWAPLHLASRPLCITLVLASLQTHHAFVHVVQWGSSHLESLALPSPCSPVKPRGRVADLL